MQFLDNIYNDTSAIFSFTFDVLKRQLWVDLLWGLSLTIIAILVNYFVHVMSCKLEKKYGDSVMDATGLMTLISVIFFIIAVLYTTSHAVQLFNPDYYAITEMKNLIMNK